MGDLMKNEGVRVLVAFCLGWFLAQICKVVVLSAKEKSITRGARAILKSGGMPSGHTASVIGALMVIGRVSGIYSVEFAIFACFAMIVIYDAVNVRWAVGEYGKAINGILGVDDEGSGRGNERDGAMASGVKNGTSGAKNVRNMANELRNEVGKQGISGVKVVMGHTVPEVICGGVLGVVIGMLV